MMMYYSFNPFLVLAFMCRHKKIPFIGMNRIRISLIEAELLSNSLRFDSGCFTS